jgi:hypothetical protein
MLYKECAAVKPTVISSAKYMAINLAWFSAQPPPSPFYGFFQIKILHKERKAGYLSLSTLIGRRYLQYVASNHTVDPFSGCDLVGATWASLPLREFSFTEIPPMPAKWVKSMFLFCHFVVACTVLLLAGRW